MDRAMLRGYAPSALLLPVAAAANAAQSAAGRLFFVAPPVATAQAKRAVATAARPAVVGAAATAQGAADAGAIAAPQAPLPANPTLTAVVTGLAVAASQAPQLGLSAAVAAPVFVTSFVPEAMLALVVGGCAAAWRHFSFKASKPSSADKVKEAVADATAAVDPSVSVPIGAAGFLMSSKGVPSKRVALKRVKKDPVMAPKRASPTKPQVGNKAKPLSPGSNYPTTKNIQTQRSGFGSFVQRFQKTEGKSKYGVPIFLKNGNINPAYLAAERKEMNAQSKRNTQKAEEKRKKLIANKQFELADYVRKAIGNVGSGKDYYQSGR